MKAARKVISILDKKKLTTSQAQVLIALDGDKALTSGALSKAMKCKPSVASDRVRGLTKPKLVKVTALQGMKLYSLTATGKRIVESLRKAG